MGRYDSDDEIPKALRKRSSVQSSGYKNGDGVPKALRNGRNYQENSRVNRNYNRVENNKKKKKKKKKLFTKILIVLVLIIGILSGVLYFFIKDKLDKINYVDINEENLSVSNNIQKGYRNIALFAVDSRDINNNKGSRSDGIIILSLNEKTKEIRLISVYRDTYLQVEGHGLTKATHAFAYGGPELAIKTLNQNLDLNISEFVAVNFDSVATAIDEMGGIEIEIKKYEVNEMNKYIVETAEITGRKQNLIPGPGVYNLDGVQATTYGRIRQVGNGDYERTERMRTVIMKVFEKAKHTDVFKLNSMIDKILPKVQTNIKSGEIIGLASQIGFYKITENIGWPYETKGKTLDAWYGIPVTLETNVKKLHEELFSNENYIAPETVKQISNKIINKTGYK